MSAFAELLDDVVWESVGTSLAQLRDGSETLERFVHEQLDGLLRLNEQLDARRQEVEQQEQAMRAEREQALERIRESEAARAGEINSHVVRLTNELEQARTELTSSQSELVDLRTSVEKQREEWEMRLAGVQSESANHAATSEELFSTRAELNAIREEMAQQASQNRLIDQSAGEETVRKLNELERQRTQLEQELEQVRHHAAQAADALDDQKRRASQERAEWSGELKQMRRTLEKQSQLLADREHHSPAAALSPATTADRDATDPVIDSVMAQFETLQKDLIRRRKQKGRTGKSGAA